MMKHLKIYSKMDITQSRNGLGVRDISYSDWFSTKTQNFIRSKTEKEKKIKNFYQPIFVVLE